jgi:ABC-type branched-subunit amino acid transport system substrate-binding protein
MHHLLTNRNPRYYPAFVYPLTRTLNPRVSGEVERLLVRALTNDINLRYQSAAEMKRDIDEILLRLYAVSVDTGGYAPGMAGLAGAVGGMGGKSATNPSPVAKVTGRIQSWLNPADGANSQPVGTQQPMPSVSPALTPLPGPSMSQLGVYVAPPQARQQRKGNRRWFIVLVAVLFLLVLVGILYPLLFLRGGLHIATQPKPGLGIGVVKAAGGEFIGLSDGSYAFDTNRPDGILKGQATDRLRAGDVSSAMALWQQALTVEANDPEPLIYLEDQRVLASGSPYITLVVGTMVTGTHADIGFSDLQGAYVAQKEYNDSAKLPGGLRVRLLIANTGNDALYAKSVAQQIVQAAQTDKTIVGVMGWPYSSRTTNAVGILAAAHLPMVSESATSVSLTGISPYFFRVAPPDTAQATVGARFAEQTLHAKAVALFVDTADTYSTSLADAFTQTFTADGKRIVVTEKYTEGQTGNLPKLLQDALDHNPDLIYFSGYSSDASVLLANLPTTGQFANVLVMGGDGLNQQYSDTARPQLGRVRFTSFAYPDEWTILGLTAQEPAFFREYPEYFNPGGQPRSSPYGFTRPVNDVMLAYDATMALLEGCRIAFTKVGNKFTPDDLRQALTTIKGAQALQGVTGQIAFGSDGNPIDKEVIVASVTQDQHFQMVGWQGRFLKGA